MTTHIVAMGGGGFSQSEGYVATDLDRFILSLTDAPNPMVCFVPTASGDNGTYVARFMEAYGHAGAGVRTSVLTLWEGAAESLRRMDEVDIFLVGGGNTVNMLALWNAHGVGRKFAAIAADTSRNVVLAGMGAGGAVWFEGCTTDGFGAGIQPFPYGLGLVKGSFCPHFDKEPERRPAYQEFVAANALPSGYGADNGTAIHAIDGRLTAFVTEREGAAIHFVEQNENGASITEMGTRSL